MTAYFNNFQTTHNTHDMVTINTILSVSTKSWSSEPLSLNRCSNLICPSFSQQSSEKSLWNWKTMLSIGRQHKPHVYAICPMCAYEYAPLLLTKKIPFDFCLLLVIYCRRHIISSISAQIKINICRNDRRIFDLWDSKNRKAIAFVSTHKNKH